MLACAGLTNFLAMDITVNIHEAKTRLSELLRKAQQGDRVIIANAGRPVAELTPIAKKEARQPDVLKGKGHFKDAFFHPMSDEEVEAWGL